MVFSFRKVDNSFKFFLSSSFQSKLKLSREVPMDGLKQRAVVFDSNLFKIKSFCFSLILLVLSFYNCSYF